MPATERRMPQALVALVVLGGILPVLLYSATLGRAPAVTPEEARALLVRPGTDALLVDVRSAGQFAANHLEGAHNWPSEGIQAVRSAADVPSHFRGKRLFLICEGGITSALAANWLRKLADVEVANVTGGNQAWVASARAPCAGLFCRLQSASGETSGLPFRESSLLEQLTIVVTGFVVKPVYTLLALVLVVVLWRQQAPDLAALRWGFSFFFLGENFCAANYLVFNDRSFLFEYLHSLGMVACFALTTYALLEGLDRRLVRVGTSQGKCAALGLCQRCVKYTDAPCGLKRMFLVVIPALMVLCLAPLTADLTAVSYNTEVFGSFHNYSHAAVGQLFEIRYCPALALVLLAISLLLLTLAVADPVPWAKVFFSAGVGASGFGLFRLVFVQTYRDNLMWFAAWEETTELLFVVSVGFTLRVFRDGLFGSRLREPRLPQGELDPGEERAAERKD